MQDFSSIGIVMRKIMSCGVLTPSKVKADADLKVERRTQGFQRNRASQMFSPSAVVLGL